MNREPTMQDVANISPTYIWMHRIVVFSAAIMIVLAAIFCIIRGACCNSIFFLLFMNILFSGVMAGLTLMWYKKGHIGMNNHWVIVVVGLIIIWQCLTTDIYVFHAPYSSANGSLPLNWTTITPSPANWAAGGLSTKLA